MTVIKATEQNQDSWPKNSDLENRYGKIGISAVAAALYSRREPAMITESHAGLQSGVGQPAISTTRTER